MECPPQPELGDTAMNKELTLGRATSAQWDEGFAGETEGAQEWTKSQIWVEGMVRPCSSGVILCCLSTSLKFPPATSSSLCSSPALTHTGAGNWGLPLPVLSHLTPVSDLWCRKSSTKSAKNFQLIYFQEQRTDKSLKQ